MYNVDSLSFIEYQTRSIGFISEAYSGRNINLIFSILATFFVSLALCILALSNTIAILFSFLNFSAHFFQLKLRQNHINWIFHFASFVLSFFQI